MIVSFWYQYSGVEVDSMIFQIKKSSFQYIFSSFLPLKCTKSIFIFSLPPSLSFHFPDRASIGVITRLSWVELKEIEFYSRNDFIIFVKRKREIKTKYSDGHFKKIISWCKRIKIKNKKNFFNKFIEVNEIIFLSCRSLFFLQFPSLVVLSLFYAFLTFVDLIYCSSLRFDNFSYPILNYLKLS